MPELPTKTCVACGRTMTWRKAWARSWDEVRYCSSACRGRGVRPVDLALEEALVALLDAGRLGALIDPEDAARVVAGRSASPVEELREPARSAARRLVASGVAEIIVSGRVVDPSRARGPISLRRTTR